MKVILSDLAKSDVKKLAKRYKNFKQDVDLFIKDISENKEIKSDKIQGVKLPIFKARIKNSSINKGKSSGFRIIYYLKINDILYIISIYSKNEIGNINKKDILNNIAELGFIKN